MQRLVQPELLDSLPSADPAARRSRRELRLINALMGNHRQLARAVRQSIQPGWRVLELGAGDGTLGRRLVAEKVCRAELLTGFDLAPRPADWPAGAAWEQGDVCAGTLPAAELVIANLFLHHFEPEALAKLGARLPASCRVLIASEPARRRRHLAQAALLSLFAFFSHVTRHDMRISIRAGFLGDELPHALGLGHWRCQWDTTLLGAYRLSAVRS